MYQASIEKTYTIHLISADISKNVTELALYKATSDWSKLAASLSFLDMTIAKEDFFEASLNWSWYEQKSVIRGFHIQQVLYSLIPSFKKLNYFWAIELICQGLISSMYKQKIPMIFSSVLLISAKTVQEKLLLRLILLGTAVRITS